MPIIVPERNSDPHLFQRLEAEGVPLIDEATAQRQDIRPARIGIMNLMPEKAMEATEIQWLRWIGRQSVLQVEPVLIKFDDDKRETRGSSRENILKRYMPLSEVKDRGGLDGLIVTGDNLELRKHAYGFASAANPYEALPETEVKYYDQLVGLLGWADSNVHSTIWSCYSAHFSLKERFGLTKEVRSPEAGKILGVFDHTVVDPSSKLTKGMNDLIKAPHSRWGDIPVKQILGEKALNLVAVATDEEIGWLLAESQNSAGGTDIYIQGHPEYYRLDLHREFERDAKEDEGTKRPPKNYYQSDVPGEENVIYLCTADGRILHENWIGGIVYPGFSQAA